MAESSCDKEPKRAFCHGINSKQCKSGWLRFSIIGGIPNLRENPLSTDFYRKFQSTDFFYIYSRIYGFLRDRGIIRKTPISFTNLRNFSY